KGAIAATVAILVGGGAAMAADIPIEEIFIEEEVVYQAPAYYARIDCSYAFMVKPDMYVSNPETHFVQKNGGRITHGDGWACGVGVGHQFGQYFRADVTLEYRGPFEVEGIRDPLVGGSIGQKTDIQSLVTMFNGYVDLGTYGGFTPYLGAGIGVAYNMMDDVLLPQTGFETLGANNFSFAWALMAGTSYDLTDRLALDAGYRYIDYGAARSSTKGSDGSSVPKITVKQLAAHEIRLGLRYAFN
ncbi:MAG: outer membrane protein, partial [Alphaproteobacteria bacterium]